MDDRRYNRRGLLKLVGVGSAVVAGAALGIRNADFSDTEDNRRQPTSTEPTATSGGQQTVTGTGTPVETDSTGTPSGPPEIVNVRDFGAKADGTTDDTQAVLNAIKAVASGGTVVLPTGTIRISAHNNGYRSDETRAAVPIERPDDGLIIEGQGSGPFGTRLVMAPDHEANHIGLEVASQSSGDSGGEHSGLTIRNLTIDGQWWEQTATESGFPNGFGVNIRGQSREVSFDNCRFQNWATNGGLMAAAGIRITDCVFRGNGYGVSQFGFYGHGFNANPGNQGGEIVVKECAFLNNTGEGVDVKSGTVRMERCLFRSNGWGIKLNPMTEEVLVRHCGMFDSGAMHIHCVPTGDKETGTLRLESVVLNGSPWAAIDLNRRPGTLEGTNILVKNANLDNERDGALYVNAYSDEGDRVTDIGMLSVHDSVGNALSFKHATGSIETLNTGLDDIGSVADLTIGATKDDDPISVSVPSLSVIDAIWEYDEYIHD